MNDEMLRCQQCNYQWKPSPKRMAPWRDKPVACPDCGSRKWDDTTS
jgi:DNA-directed RNA polymerase subunit RPC12/RpoP